MDCIGENMIVSTKGLTSEDEKVRQGAVMHKELTSTEHPDPAHMTVIASGVPEAPYKVTCTVFFSVAKTLAW